MVIPVGVLGLIQEAGERGNNDVSCESRLEVEI
jgi:hypothetical protein